MGFSSIDDFVQETTVNGKVARVYGSRTINTGATSVIGRWHETFAGGGIGGTGVLTGTAGAAVALSSSTTGAIPLNAAVDPDTRHLFKAQVVTNSTVVTPGQAMLVDLLLMYPSCVATGAPTVLNNTVTMPTRWGGTLGANCQIFGVPVTAGFSAANQSYTLSYTNTTPATGRSATLVAGSNSTPVGGLLGGGVAGTINSPAANLQAGDIGVQKIDSYTIGTASSSGALTMVIYRPIVTLPLIGANIVAERDLLPELPRIPDGACLAWLVNVGAVTTANQTLYSELQYAWG